MNEKNESKKDVLKDATKEIIKEFVSEKLFYSQEEANEMVLRIGDAMPIEIPKGLKITGAINAPSAFWDKRKGDNNPQKCHVTFDKTSGRITLNVNETTNEGHSITGQIEQNPDLVGMRINQNKMFHCKELMDHLKFNRVLFKEVAENTKIVTALQKYKTTIINDQEMSDDHRGKSNNVNNFEVKHDFQESFTLKCPIFKAGNEKTFRVDICLSATDGGVVFWLESRELKEIESTERWELIDKELKNFEELVKIEQ